MPLPDINGPGPIIIALIAEFVAATVLAKVHARPPEQDAAPKPPSSPKHSAAEQSKDTQPTCGS